MLRRKDRAAATTAPGPLPADRARRIGLVGCVKQKRSSPAPAADLYTSPLFRGRRQWVEQTCGRWFILSAEHGLVRPDVVLAPYDQTLTGAGVAACRTWSAHVLGQLAAELGDLRGIVFEIHAGAAYRDHGLAAGLQRAGAQVDVPAAGLAQGEQLAFYKAGPNAPSQLVGAERALALQPPPSPPARSRGSAPPLPLEALGSAVGVVASVAGPGGRTSAYSPLAAYLTSIGGTRTTLTLHEVAAIVGRELPASAHTHRAWWANDPSHSQARGWLAARWRVASIDQTGGTVTFERG
jgi:hypothetical protein